MRHNRWLCAPVAAWVVTACGGGPGGGTLGLVDVRPHELDSVALNEELVFYFTEDLDRTSITSESVRVLDDRGLPVAGERRVRGNALSFVPDLPCAPDLSDGGLRPGTRYRIVLGGFPRPDGVRADSGELLSASLQLDFRTAHRGGPGPLFLDPFLDPSLLTPRVEGGHVYLECAEALDPSSVPAARFSLTRLGEDAQELVMNVRLVRNLREHAVLLLEPADPERMPIAGLAPGRYFLHQPEVGDGADGGLRSLGGRDVRLPPWEGRPPPLLVPQWRVEIDLGALGGRSPEAPGACAGTALWDPASSALVVRYPRAAGSGSAGEVVLAEAPRATDLQATHLEVPQGTVVDLSDLRGPVVLRSQTSIDVRGRLTRAGAQKPQDPPTLSLLAQLEREEEDRQDLSEWLAWLTDPGAPWSDQPWTVIIAGGDIRVPRGGSIEVEGPLVLVAGGWIRAESNVIAHGDLWKTREGGGSSTASLQVIPLRIDPPELNPLRTFLSVGVVTHPIPWDGRWNGWSTRLRHGEEGAGRISVLLRQELGADEPDGPWLRDPSSLVSGRARVLVRFEMDPGNGEVWAPPRCTGIAFEPLGGTEPASSLR